MVPDGTEVGLKVEIRIHKQVKQIDYEPGESLLETAMRAEANPPYSCMEGMCTACMAKVVQGKVQFPDHTVLSEEDFKNGKILTCQALIKEEQDLVIIDYDAV